MPAVRSRSLLVLLLVPLLVAVLAVAAGVGPGRPQQAAAAVTGLWKVDCTYVKSAKADPILLPKQPGASHGHDFFGNIGTNAYSTYARLAGVTSTCAHGDRSAYWVPGLFRNGRKVRPSSLIAYYEKRAAGRIEPYPPGFRMIFGNAKATAGSKVDVHIEWGRTGNTQISAKVPASCATGAIQLRMMWPYCWDGVTPAGNAPMSVTFAPGGVCPADHPHALPTLRTNIVYPVGTTTGTITLSSGPVESAHGDFFNAWEQDVLVDLVDRCLNGNVDCGHFTGTSPGLDPPGTGAAQDGRVPVQQLVAPSAPSGPAGVVYRMDGTPA